MTSCLSERQIPCQGTALCLRRGELGVKHQRAMKSQGAAYCSIKITLVSSITFPSRSPSHHERSHPSQALPAISSALGPISRVSVDVRKPQREALFSWHTVLITSWNISHLSIWCDMRCESERRLITVSKYKTRARPKRGAPSKESGDQVCV